MSVSDADATADPSAEGGEEKEKLDLEVRVDSTSSCGRHVTVTVSKADVQRYFDEAFTELMPKANVPGFRSGRAPRKLVESRFKSEITDQVKGSLLMDSMGQVTTDADFAAISEPEFEYAYEILKVENKSMTLIEFEDDFKLKFRKVGSAEIPANIKKELIAYAKQLQELIDETDDILSEDDDLEQWVGIEENEKEVELQKPEKEIETKPKKETISKENKNGSRLPRRNTPRNTKKFGRSCKGHCYRIDFRKSPY